MASKVSGYKDEVLGSAKETVGKALGNEQMQAEGAAKNMYGHAEVEAAKGQQRVQGTGEQFTGNVKNAVGKVIGNEQMRAEGDAEWAKGKARSEANK